MRRYGLVDIPDQASDIDAVPITRTITIDGTTYDLSVNRTWTTAGGSNIYNSDGTLTGNRTLTQSTYSLTFAGTTSSRFHFNGNFSVGTTTDIGAKLNVLGQAVFGDFVTQFKGVIAYSAAGSTRLSVYDGKVLFTNAGDVSLWFDAGGSSAGGQPVKIYSEPYAGVPTQYPLCIQGNGLETIFGQNTITTNASSLVTMVSTTKGFLPPRMTSAQRTAIGSPATGLIVYQTDGSAGLYVRNAAAWQLLGSGGGGGVNIYNSDGGLSSNRILDFVEYSLYFGTSNEYVNYAFHRKGVIPGIQILALSADRTLTNTTSQQAFFTPSFNTLTLVQSQTYFFSGVFYLTTMSATSGNLTIDIKGGGTITISSIMYFTTGFDNNNVGTANTLSGGVSTTSSYSTPVTAETGTQLILRFEGTLRIPLLGGGTIIPSVSLTNAASAIAKANSYFQIYPVSIDTMTKVQVD